MRDFLRRRLLTLVVATVLLAAMVLGATACNNENGGEETTTSTAVTTTTAPEGNVVGEGQTTFTFEVAFVDGTTKVYTVKTDATTVGDALLGVGLIAGEESTYGLYVKTVDGVTLDYETDQKYWAFYENGAYAQVGVDATNITEGATYAFRAE